MLFTSKQLSRQTNRGRNVTLPRVAEVIDNCGMSHCAVAPADPYIDGYANNSVVSVNSTQQSMTLTCWCRDAKPPPAVTWLRNDVVVTSSATSSGVTSSKAADGRLWDAWSVVRVDELRRQLSGDVYTCRCENDASTAPSLVVVRLHVLGQ